MQDKIVWQQGSTTPENPNNLAAIGQWWSNLANKEISFAQRLIPQTGKLDELNWEPQRFDEVFQLKQPQLRGITLYWYKPDSEQERNITPHQLALDTRRQQLYIFPQTQKQIVIRVGLPEVIYETIEINNPQLETIVSQQKYILTVRDAQQLIEVKINLDQDNINYLKQSLE